jgi:hydrogenase nickel incorporation protein HypA/HybF
MHELPVANGILATALEAAEKAGAGRITQIDIVLGALSGYVGDSIQFYFDFISQGTKAEGARLNVRRIPATCHCWDCGSDFSCEEILPPECPGCAGSRLQVVGGQEFYMESINVEWRE